MTLLGAGMYISWTRPTYRLESYTGLHRIWLYLLEGRYVQSPKSKTVLTLLEMLLKQLKMALDLKKLVGMNLSNHKKKHGRKG